MTQSGQGEEPSPRVAREGIVLPSDGGEPLLPGQTGGPGGYQSAPHVPNPTPAPPPGGQAWGTPWGPEQQTPAPQQGEGWGAPQEQQWGAPDPYQAQAQQWGAQDASQPLPQPGGYDNDQPTSYYLPPVDQNPQHGAGPGAPLPPAGHDSDQPTSYYLPPVNPDAGGGYGVPGAPLPPATDAYGTPAGHGGATGVPLPPADEGATQYIPPVAASPDEGATQYIPPVAPGALPPEVPAQGVSEQTQFLGRAPQSGGPLPPVSGPDAEATQYIAPVPGQHGGERQPPAEFDNLFRSGPGGESPAGATQQLPRFERAQPPHTGQQQPSYGHRDHHDDGGGRGGRNRSRVPLIAAVGIGIAVLGIGAGALLAGGGGDDGDGNKTVAATAPASESASPSADPAKAQAVELDKLLADSGDSRASVISAVEDVKACKNLGQAAKDLRDAATQRNDLVTRLSTLSVDRLPNHAQLTTALTKAWQASASADNHYATWADQTAGKKGCKKGQARTTGQTQAGNTASGEASTQKITAAKLWNAIAKTYGLTERNRTQL
ncbi:hypothetical protein [Streptomyces sp. WM6386]|uniref:hypothetical protein n=1 Tax=Streptomyces sp. WM6386 TaxID=1415558 RepID=UPI000BA21BF5|nr:hypothetical protein [Streptomyces sp. WM6386]